MTHTRIRLSLLRLGMVKGPIICLIGQKNRIVLPIEVLKFLQVAEGGYVALEFKGDHVTLTGIELQRKATKAPK